MRPILEVFKQKKNSKQDSIIYNFFLNFAESLASGNVDTIKKSWALPSYILGDRASTLITSDENLEKFFSNAQSQYQKRGLNMARPIIQHIQKMTDQIIVVDIKWPYLDKTGTEIGAEFSSYTLKLDQNGKLKIHTVIMVGEKITKPYSAH